MRALLVLLAVAALAYGKAVDSSIERSGRERRCVCQVNNNDDDVPQVVQDFRDKITEINAKANEVASKVKFLEMKLSGGVAGAENTDRVKNLLLRVGALQEKQCPALFFACGDVANTCVSKLLVCDQASDCPNGRDEDDFTCVTPASAGSHFEGRVVFDTCTQRRPQKVGLFITETERDHTFPSVVNVKAQFIAMSEHSDYSFNGGLILKGKYFYAKRKIVFDAPEDDGLGVEVDFLPGDNDLMTFSVVRETTGDVCAKADLQRIN